MKIAQTARRIGADIRDFVAALVILAGTAGIIWLYIWLMNGLNRLVAPYWPAP